MFDIGYKNLFFPIILSSSDSPRTRRARFISTLGIMFYSLALVAVGMFMLYRGLRSNDLLYFAVLTVVSAVVLTIGIHAFIVSIASMFSLRRRKSVRR